MKANAPKRKVFNDAVDMLTGGEPAAAGKGVQMLPVESIIDLYMNEGEGMPSS